MKTSSFVASIVLLAVFLLPSLACANVTITLTDLGLGTPQELVIYDPTLPYNESQIAIINGSSSVLELSEGNYIFAMLPSDQHWFDNPFNFADLFERSAPTLLAFAICLTLIAGAGAVLFYRRR